MTAARQAGRRILDAEHSAHELCLAAVRGHRPAPAGHAAVETFVDAVFVGP